MNRPPGTPEDGVQGIALEGFIRSWGERECCSFDEAIERVSGGAGGTHSIWDMPSIDSKRVVSLLVELEQLLGRPVPCSVIRRGGYASVEDLVVDLVPKIRQGTSQATPPAVPATFDADRSLAAAARRPSH